MRAKREKLIMESCGTVKWFDIRKGFGFISDEDGVDYFVHASEIQEKKSKRLREGQQVTFLLGEDEKGRAVARMVRVDEEKAFDTSGEVKA